MKNLVLAPLLRWPWSCATLVVAVTLFACLRLIDWDTLESTLEVDPSITALLPRAGADLALFEDVRERFASDDLLLVTWVGDELFTPRRLRAFKALARRIERMPGI